VKRSTAALAILGVFLVGGIAGVCGTHLFYLRHLREPGGMVGWGARLLAADLKHDLDLTSKQARQIDAILLETRKETIAIRRKMMPEMMVALQRSRHRIEAILTPAQRQKFERMRERRLGRFRHWMGGR
jgi:Spy/CpxP family protein refolding chaperone